ncbi:MAG: hypothetical protein ABSH03_17145 [Candidatus Lustribacter sp.]
MNRASGTMDETFVRLRALDGKPVWVALLRSKDGTGVPVYRSGTFRLFDRPSAQANPATRIVDANDLALVTFRGSDMLSIVDETLRVALRPTFRVDVSDRPFPAPESAEPLDFERVTRELVAELEAAFRNALILRPDPDPDASARAQRGIPPVEDGPLVDRSVRFAVGHASATLRPEGTEGVRLTCIGSSVRAGKQFADLFEPEAGADYAFEPGEVVRLGADVRAFLSDRRAGFRSYSASM